MCVLECVCASGALTHQVHLMAGVRFGETPSERHLTISVKIKNALALGLCNAALGSSSHSCRIQVLS